MPIAEAQGRKMKVKVTYNNLTGEFRSGLLFGSAQINLLEGKGLEDQPFLFCDHGGIQHVYARDSTYYPGLFCLYRVLAQTQCE